RRHAGAVPDAGNNRLTRSKPRQETPERPLTIAPEQSRSAWSRRRRRPFERPRPATPASRRKRYPRPEGSNMTVRARHRAQAKDRLRPDQGLSDRLSTIENGEASRNEPQPRQQLVRRPTTAGSGAEPEARRAIGRKAGDRGLHHDQEHDEEASR